jgi:hypothetical protein
VRVATFNINNIKKRLDNLLAWLAKAEPDVVSLQELKADQEASGEHMTRCHRNSRSQCLNENSDHALSEALRVYYSPRHLHSWGDPYDSAPESDLRQLLNKKELNDFDGIYRFQESGSLLLRPLRGCSSER